MVREGMGSFFIFLLYIYLICDLYVLNENL